MKLHWIALLFGVIFIYACADQKPLPIYGEMEIVGSDTVYHSIPDFSFINQDSTTVTNAAFENHIYAADFFFINCPSICPIVRKQMLRIYEKFENEPILKLVSHTMDPVRDTPEALKIYAKNLDVNTDKWQFLTGDKYELSEISSDYFSIVIEDKEAPGGFDHSGKIILVDKDRHIRAFCEGTDEDDVTEFLKDVQKLIDEYKQ